MRKRSYGRVVKVPAFPTLQPYHPHPPHQFRTMEPSPPTLPLPPHTHRNFGSWGFGIESRCGGKGRRGSRDDVQIRPSYSPSWHIHYIWLPEFEFSQCILLYLLDCLLSTELRKFISDIYQNRNRNKKISTKVKSANISSKRLFVSFIRHKKIKIEIKTITDILFIIKTEHNHKLKHPCRIDSTLNQAWLNVMQRCPPAVIAYGVPFELIPICYYRYLNFKRRYF